MEISQYLLKVAISLLIVLLLILLLLPYLIRRLTGIRSFSGKGSFTLKKVQPIARNAHLVEIEVKGKTLLILISEKGADVIYREDDKTGGGGSDHRLSGSGAGDPAG